MGFRFGNCITGSFTGFIKTPEWGQVSINSSKLVEDSGTLSEESAMLGFAGVPLRTSTERPEVLDKGAVVIGGITGRDVEQAIELAVVMRENGEPVVLACVECGILS